MNVEVFEREIRIGAPVALVWEEIGSLSALSARAPQPIVVSVAADGNSATLTGTLALGPIRHSFEAQADVVELAPRAHIGYRVVSPALDSQYEGHVRLHQVGSGETVLGYRGELHLGSWTAQRLRGLIVDLLEEHLHGVTDQAKARAERHHRAKQAFDD